MTWEAVALWLNEDYGSFVNWDERFFVCPECGEPIYEIDWAIMDVCPVCGFGW